MKSFPLLIIAFTFIAILALFKLNFYNIFKGRNNYMYGIIGAMDVEIETLVAIWKIKKKRIIMV